MLKSLSAVVLAAAAVVTMTAQAAAQAGTLTSADKSFLTKAIAASKKEVAAGKAESSNANQYVRYFANRMVHDHSIADDELIALAQKDGVFVPSIPNLGPTPNAKQYMQEQVAAHEQAVALFTQESQDGTGQAKALAAKLLPVLKQHLSMAEQFENTGKITPTPDLVH